MSTNSPTPLSMRGPDCAALAPLLALRDTGLLDERDKAAVAAHVAGCLACQRAAVLDGQLADALRRYLLAPATQLAQLTPDMIAARVVADDQDMGVARSLPPARTRATSYWLAGVPAIAAVLLVALLAAYLFGSHARTSGVVAPIPTLSPLLAQQAVYLPTGNGIYALRASDGHIRWTYPAGIDQLPIVDPRAITGLVLDNGVLYACIAAGLVPNGAPAEPGGIVALRAASGHLIWQSTMLNGCTGSLALSDGTLYVVPNPQDTSYVSDSARVVAALHASDGKVLWSSMLSDAAISGPVVSGGEVFVATATHLVALHAHDGKQLWTTPIMPGASQEGTSPAPVNSSVALTAAGGTLYVLAKRQYTRGDSTHSARWEANFYAITTTDGTHLWRDSVENDPWDTAFPPTVSGNVTYVQWGPGVTAIALSGSTPEQVWQFIPEGAVAQANEAMTGAALASGIIYTSDWFGVDFHQNGVGAVMGTFTYAIRASNGHEIWRVPTNAGLMGQTPVVAGGLVFCPGGDDLQALRAPDGHLVWDASANGAHITGPPIFGA